MQTPKMAYDLMPGDVLTGGGIIDAIDTLEGLNGPNVMVLSLMDGQTVGFKVTDTVYLQTIPCPECKMHTSFLGISGVCETCHYASQDAAELKAER